MNDNFAIDQLIEEIASKNKIKSFYPIDIAKALNLPLNTVIKRLNYLVEGGLISLKYEIRCTDDLTQLDLVDKYEEVLGNYLNCYMCNDEKIITLDNITYLVSQWVSIVVPILFIIQLVFAGLILGISRQIRKASVDKKTTETLFFYTKQLEDSQRSLRQFKHDYQNILISMEAELKDNDNFKELLAYSASHLEKSKAWRFNDLDNVSDPEIKSIVISKLDNCFTNSLPVSFECRQPLREIQGINKFDLIRLLGIAFDNAIEASENFTAPEIKVLLLNTDVGFEFEIRNKVASTFDTTKLQQAGVTTKEGHAGLGLASAQAIISNYNNVFLARAIKDNWFTFTLYVNKEG